MFLLAQKGEEPVQQLPGHLRTIFFRWQGIRRNAEVNDQHFHFRVHGITDGIIDSVTCGVDKETCAALSCWHIWRFKLPFPFVDPKFFLLLF